MSAKLLNFLKTHEPKYDNWLPANYSQAYMCCIGAGPWKFNRRKTIQHQALIWLGNKDLSEVTTVDIYPLTWQNNMVFNLVRYLRDSDLTMVQFCHKLIEMTRVDQAMARKTLYMAAGSPKGTKVLSLFCRDSLKVECFPIDRHVKRMLIEYNLPCDEDALISTCKGLGLDPKAVATAMVYSKLDKGNPNWANFVI